MKDATDGAPRAGPVPVVVRPTPKRSDKAWREVVDPGTGGALFICPTCWPAAGAYWRSRPNATVRAFGARPDWAQCAVCDPDRMC